MVLQNTSVEQLGNDPFYAKLFLYITLGLFIFLSVFYYIGNPLNIYHFIGLKTITFTLFVIFFFIALIVIYNLYFDEEDVFYNSKSLFEFISLFGSQYIYILFVSLLSFYIFIKFFEYFQNQPQITETLMKIVLYGSITLIALFSISTFTSLLGKSKNSKFPLQNLLSVLKNLFYYLGCFLNDTMKYIQDDIQKTNIFSIYLLITFVIIIFVSYVIPLLTIYFILYDGKQLLNSPVYLNKSNYLTSYNDLNKDIINSNIFKYISQKFYNSYDSFMKNQETYINLGDPNLNYEINEKLEELKDEFDPELLQNILDENPDMVDNINQLMNDPDSLREYIKSLSPFQGEYTDQIMNYLNSFNTITTDKTVDQMLRPRIDYNYNYNDKLNYNYSISCWFYIDNYDGNKEEITDIYKSIIKFGNKLDASYNPYLKQLKVQVKSCPVELINSNLVSDDSNDDSNDENKTLLNKNKCKTKIAFRSKDILLQKWNHIVFNYDSGTLDIFINNRIVSSTPNISPLFFNDAILVGDNDGVEGAICNVMYFSNVLSKRDIDKIYKYFYTSTPPIL